MSNTQGLWQELRALRSAPVGYAAHDAERRAVFTSALRQSQELAAATAAAGYAAKPLPLYYCLTQGMRAAAAATISGPAWRIVRHGASVKPSPSGMLDSVIDPRPSVRGDSMDVVSAVQHMDGNADRLTERMTLRELWISTPSAPPLPDALGGDCAAPLLLHRPLASAVREASAAAGRLELAVEGLSRELRDADLPAALNRYPTLAGGRSVRPHVEGSELSQYYVFDHPQVIYNSTPRGFINIAMGAAWVDTSPVIHWAVDGADEDSLGEALESLARVGTGDERTRLAFPRLGGSDSPSFLALRLRLLLALSSLARYEPAMWVEGIDPDRSPVSVPLERTCDQAEEFIPSMLHVMLVQELDVPT